MVQWGNGRLGPWLDDVMGGWDNGAVGIRMLELWKDGEWEDGHCDGVMGVWDVGGPIILLWSILLTSGFCCEWQVISVFYSDRSWAGSLGSWE